MDNIKISTKNNHEDELNVVEIVKELLNKYEIPILTNTIIVERDSIPHSHPILTLNTRTKDPLVILKTLIHEQMHWFERENYKEVLNYLKQNYPDNGECNKYGKNPNSFWDHIIVCFNTRNILKKLVTKEELEYIYNQWQAYPLTEKLIVDNFEKIKSDLEQYNMVLK